jgi:hypothetical protein
VTIAVHLVAHTRGSFRGVCGAKSARWLWARLKAAFPRAFALCLMPDHVHLVVPGGIDQALLRRVLAQHGRLFGCGWHRVEATPCTTVEILLRAIRYVLINPVRDGRVGDPWAWPYSTLRELGGVVDDDWTRADVRRLVRGPWARVLERITQLDDGTVPPVPRAPDFDQPPVASFASMAAAVASALRGEPEDVTRRTQARRVFIQLALAVGHPRPCELAAACGVTLQAVRDAARVPDPIGLRFALTCLQDDRLRIHDEPPAVRRAATA